MSYEIRTPLSSVVGFAELFNSEHDEADEPLFVEEIKRSTNTLLLLVNDVLFLSRLDARMEEYKKEETDFVLAFESMCQIGLITVKPGVKTVVAHPYNSLVVDIDAEHVGQIIRQLTSNAAQYTSTGAVRARYEYIGRRLILSVDDTGEGIPQEELERLNQSNYASHVAINTKGLGLAICQELVKQMNGSIEFSTEEGSGTTIYVTIPCQATIIKRKR
jgi:signal transduction histidine kinase